MIDVHAALIAIVNLVLVVAIYHLIFVWIPAIRIAEFRQYMFELRDRMFDDAEAGLLSFEDRAYRHLRVTMNGLCAEADDISFTNLVSFIVNVKKTKEGPAPDEFASALSAAPENRRVTYQKYLRSMDELVLVLIGKRNPVLYAFFFSLALGWATARGMRSGKVKRWLAATEEVAYRRELAAAA